MSSNNEIAELKKRIEMLEDELGIQQDIHAIRRLQYIYGYFIDKPPRLLSFPAPRFPRVLPEQRTQFLRPARPVVNIRGR